MTNRTLATHHTILTPEQLSRAHQRGDVDSIEQIPNSQDSLIPFAQAILVERVRRNREQPQRAEAVKPLPAIIEEIQDAIGEGNVPVKVECPQEVLDIIQASQ